MDSFSLSTLFVRPLRGDLFEKVLPDVAVSPKTATMHSSAGNIYNMISSLSSTLTELKTVLESTGKMGSDIYQLSGQVHARSEQIQKIMNEP